MALAELRDRLARPFEQMRETTMMDETTLYGCLNEITCALLDADLPRSLVKARRLSILLPPNMLAQLISTLDPGKSAVVQAGNHCEEPTIVMFIGLRGVGKTKMCAKYARYHLNKGFKPALVCAHTFKADAFLRLKAAATDEVPVSQSCGKDDRAKIASEGIAKFKKEERDLIIVDTSNRHAEYSLLFEEMRCLAETVNPDLVMYVMDSNIGQAAFDQAQAFKQSFPVGAVMVTNVNTAPKAFGAISAVAAAQCPMILAETGTGVKGEEFEAFEAKPFVRSLFKNPWVSPNYQPGYSLRQMFTFYRRQLGLETENDFTSPLNARSRLSDKKVKLYVTIMDSMTDEELDKSNLRSKERVMEIAEASKVDVKQVVEMLKTYMKQAKSIAEFEERLFKKPDKVAVAFS